MNRNEARSRRLQSGGRVRHFRLAHQRAAVGASPPAPYVAAAVVNPPPGHIDLPPDPMAALTRISAWGRRRPIGRLGWCDQFGHSRESSKVLRLAIFPFPAKQPAEIHI